MSFQYQLKPLLKEIGKYSNAKEFERAHNGNMMDLSNPKAHRFGRMFSSNGDGTIEDLVAINKVYGKDGVDVLSYEESANVPEVTDPNQLVTIYRSAPKSAKGILPGDWISFSKDYADSHARGKIISEKVPAKDVIWPQADFHEWVYSPDRIRKNYKSLQDFYNKEKGTVQKKSAFPKKKK